jgi:hypothetical protein
MFKWQRKGLFVIGYEHNPAKINLNPLIDSFELIARNINNIDLSNRIEENRYHLIHPEHQIVRCFGWEIY